MTTIGELKRRADAKLYSGSFREALGLYTALLKQQPLNLDARLRVGDALMALGEVQRAAVVYTKLAQHAARAGYPLRALCAIKILSALEPQLGELVRGVAALYACDSERLGRGVRRSPPDPNQPLPADFDLAAPVAASEEDAERIASDYQHPDVLYPDKLMPIPVLSLLNREEFAAVIGSIRLVRSQPGAAIIEQDAEGRSFFVLVRGSAEVSRADGKGAVQQLATLHEGAIFGEMALLTDARRSASVHAIDDCDLLEFDRDALTKASETVTSLTVALAGFAQERLLNNVLNTAAIFQPLDHKQRQDLVRRFVVVEAQPGQVVIQQDEPGRGLYVVLRGEVSIERTEDDRCVELARLGPGDLLGEISLLGDEPTSATVTATVPTGLLFLGREYFARLVDAVPEIRSRLERLSEERIMDTRLSMTQDMLEPFDDDEEAIEVEVLI